jgi:hypothetical protein
MNYSDMSKLYKNKFSAASYDVCIGAIKDIDETLKLYPNETTDNHYISKLFCERDAALDRKMVLSKKNHFPNLSYT